MSDEWWNELVRGYRKLKGFAPLTASEAAAAYDAAPAEPLSEERIAEIVRYATKEVKMSSAEKLARRFHELYEELALELGYETRTASRVPWDSVPPVNKSLMLAVSTKILAEFFEVSKASGVLQGWVTGLGLRHQGVLITAMRGCDGVEKHDASKPIMRAIRWACLVPFDRREVKAKRSFMHYDSTEFPAEVDVFGKSLDVYPLHFVMHVIHALEVIGYCYPEYPVAFKFMYAYWSLVKKLHLKAESKEEMDARLTEDRVAKGTVEA